jgi:uncharacterized membrane protein
MNDSHLRSLIKGISWRTTGTIDTMVVSFFVTGDFFTALKIGSSEILTKVGLYYLHERIWNVIKWGRMEEGPTHSRSFVKGISWRAVGTMDTMMLSYLITGNVSNALRIGFTELFTKIILYYLHERVWSAIKWGRIMKKEAAAETVYSRSASLRRVG